MNGRPFLAICLAWILIGVVLPESGPAQRAKQEAAPAYVLVPKSAKKIKAGMTFEVKVPRVEAEEWSLFITQLPALPGQFDVRTTLFPRGNPARDLSDEGRPLLFVRMPSEGQRWRQNASIRVEYEATLLERKLESQEPGGPAAPIVAPLDARTRRLELAAGHQFDFQAPSFRNWLKEKDLRRSSGENEVDFARKAFLAVRKGFNHYEGADVEHLASRVSVVGKSDFAGLTAVFVAALRANGIPTRALGGRMVINEGKPAKGCWPHAKAEFYAQGIGWVPADPAGAIRSGRQDDGLDFFGNDSAEFLTYHINTDIVIHTYDGEHTLEWLPDATWWVLGPGSVAGAQSKCDMTVEVEPLDLAEFLANKATRPNPKKQASKKSR